MDFKEALTNLFRPALQSQQQAALRVTLEAVREAKVAENYTEALAQIDRAFQIAHTEQDHDAELVAALHQGEIFMRQGRYADATTLSQRLLMSAHGATQRSYVYSLIGTVAQAQGDWVGARAAYERALEYAREARAAGAEGRALGHLGDTYLHDGNASYAGHLLRDALSKLLSAGDVELSSYFTGLMGQALISSGQEAEGQHLLERALRLAEQTGYRIYERLWVGLLGDRALAEGRYQDAYLHYTHALRLFAPETVSVDYVRVVSQMSKACLSLRNTTDALVYAQIAHKSAEKLQDTSAHAMAQGALGVALRAVGRSAEAIPYLQAAADSTGTQIDVLRSLAAAQADSGDSDSALATYQRAIQQAEATGTPLELAQARRDLGLISHRRKDLHAAINEWTAALATYEEQRAYSQVARLYCDIGGARKALGQRARAMKDYEQALMVLNSLDGSDQETRGLVLSNAANAYAEQGDVESADAFFTESISIAERLGDQVAETTRNGNYGWFLLLVGRPRRAIATLERALAISQPLKLSLQLAIQYDNLGLVYDSLGDYPAALERHQKALAVVNDPLWAGQFKVSLANTLISTAALDEAKPLLDEALAQGRESAHADLTIMALIGQARLWIVREQPAAAEDAITEALALARKIDNRRLIAESLSLRSQQHAALDHPGEAAAVWEEAQRLYLMLHMPQGKTQPAWLSRSTTRT